MTITRTLAAAAALIALSAQAEARTPEEAAKACEAKGQFYKLSPAHKAGETNPRTGAPFKRDSSGVCRLDGAKVKALVAAQPKQ